MSYVLDPTYTQGSDRRYQILCSFHLTSLDSSYITHTTTTTTATPKPLFKYAYIEEAINYGLSFSTRLERLLMVHSAVRPKHDVPQRRCYTEVRVLVLVVMLQVVSLQESDDSPW